MRRATTIDTDEYVFIEYNLDIDAEVEYDHGEERVLRPDGLAHECPRCGCPFVVQEYADRHEHDDATWHADCCIAHDGRCDSTWADMEGGSHY